MKLEESENDPIITHLDKWRYPRNASDVDYARYFSSNKNNITLNEDLQTILLKDAAEYVAILQEIADLSYTQDSFDKNTSTQDKLKQFYQKIGDKLFHKLMQDKSWLASDIDNRPGQVNVKQESHFYIESQKNLPATLIGIFKAYVFALQTQVLATANRDDNKEIRKKFESMLNDKEQQYLENMGNGGHRKEKDKRKIFSLFKKNEKDPEKINQLSESKERSELREKFKPLYRQFLQVQKFSFEYYETEFILTRLPVIQSSFSMTPQEKENAYLDIFFSHEVFNPSLDSKEIGVNTSLILVTEADSAELNRALYIYYLDRKQDEFLQKVHTLEDRIVSACRKKGGVSDVDMNNALKSYFVELTTSIVTRTRDAKVEYDFLKKDIMKFIGACKKEIEYHFAVKMDAAARRDEKIDSSPKFK